MNSITRNDVSIAPKRSSVSFSDRFTRVLNWLERAHARRPRQEFWQSLHLQLRRDRAAMK